MGDTVDTASCLVFDYDLDSDIDYSDYQCFAEDYDSGTFSCTTCNRIAGCSDTDGDGTVGLVEFFQFADCMGDTVDTAVALQAQCRRWL